MCYSGIIKGILITYVVIDIVMCSLKGAFILPHGGIALDPSKFHTTNTTAFEEALKLHTACVRVGNYIANIQPDVIFLSTPHGIADLKNFLFYLNPSLEGFAKTDNTYPPPYVSVSAKLDVNLSNGIIQRLASSTSNNISGLTAYGPPGESTEPFPLRWGEVVPLHFVPISNKTKLVVISQPSRRYNDDMTTMIPELLRLGADIENILQNQKKSVVVIISADLAHTHSKDGPYGYSDAAQPFDDACGTWVQELDKESLTSVAAKYVVKAKSCGYTGLVMLQGMLSASNMSSWKSELYANYHPSYYGMMVASFLKR